MKNRFIKNLVCGFFTLFIACTCSSVFARGVKKENKKNDTAVKVLVVGLHDNVQSNYFSKCMITEETGIPEDSIGYIYNHIITDNIIEENKDEDYNFISSEENPLADCLTNTIILSGTDEEQYADVSQIERKDYARLIDDTDVDYVLFLNQHYLKWQEEPLRTLFHFVTYSLYDKNLQEVTRGNNYFTCMNLGTAEDLSKASRKSSSKIASTIIKSIAK